MEIAQDEYEDVLVTYSFCNQILKGISKHFLT